MTNWAILIWILLVIAGAVLASVRTPPTPGLRAVDALRQDTLILPGPFVPKPFENRYVTPDAGISANGPVTDDLVAAAPVLPALAHDRALVSVPVAWDDVLSGVNAGVPSKLCRESSDLGLVSVTAVRCLGDQDTRTCETILQVPIAPDGVIKELAKPEKLYVARICRKGP